MTKAKKYTIHCGQCDSEIKDLLLYSTYYRFGADYKYMVNRFKKFDEESFKGIPTEIAIKCPICGELRSRLPSEFNRHIHFNRIDFIGEYNNQVKEKYHYGRFYFKIVSPLPIEKEIKKEIDRNYFQKLIKETYDLYGDILYRDFLEKIRKKELSPMHIIAISFDDLNNNIKHGGFVNYIINSKSRHDIDKMIKFLTLNQQFDTSLYEQFDVSLQEVLYILEKVSTTLNYFQIGRGKIKNMDISYRILFEEKLKSFSENSLRLYDNSYNIVRIKFMEKFNELLQSNPKFF